MTPDVRQWSGPLVFVALYGLLTVLMVPGWSSRSRSRGTSDTNGCVAASARIEPLDDWLSGRGFVAVRGVHFADFLLATVIGIVPGTVAFVLLGDALGRPGPAQFLGALGAIVVMALAAMVFSPAWHRRA